MGYTKIVQYGDKVEVYNYEKAIYPKRHRVYKKRRYELNRAFRSERSVRRAILNFYRLCHHNNYRADSIHFVTITYSHDLPYKEACRHVARFMERIRAHSQKVPISFISVPELTKKGRYHFHLLVYNLPTEIAGDTISVRRYNRRKRQWQVEYATTERFTRNLQRQFGQGYIDISPATYRSDGLAGYMAKYMAKAFNDFKNEATRFYNCSRNIDKVTMYGSNTLNAYMEHLYTGRELVETKRYEVKFMGRCVLNKYQQ